MHYVEIRKDIYTNAKKNKKEIIQFFLEDANDNAIINSKIDSYNENIKIDTFYGGIIEISIFEKFKI